MSADQDKRVSVEHMLCIDHVCITVYTSIHVCIHMCVDVAQVYKPVTSHSSQMPQFT